MKLRYKLPLFFGTLLSAIILAVVLSVQFSPTKAQADENSNIVGAWYVNANGAPFVPHVMEFHNDNTFIIDNPDAGDSHTSDSLGVGPWKVGQNNNNKVKGKFVEVNADRTTHLFVNNLIVTFEVTLSGNGNTFTGPAEARYYDANWNLVDGPFPATLDGKRIKFDSLP